MKIIDIDVKYVLLFVVCKIFWYSYLMLLLLFSVIYI